MTTFITTYSIPTYTTTTTYSFSTNNLRVSHFNTMTSFNDIVDDTLSGIRRTGSYNYNGCGCDATYTCYGMLKDAPVLLLLLLLSLLLSLLS